MKVQVKILGNEFRDQEWRFLVKTKNKIKELKKKRMKSRRQLNRPLTKTHTRKHKNPAPQRRKKIVFYNPKKRRALSPKTVTP